MNRKYKNQELQRVYDHYRLDENTPYFKPEVYGQSIEWRGANIRNAYWCGRNNVPYVRFRTSPLHAAYMAGQDLQKELDR